MKPQKLFVRISLSTAALTALCLSLACGKNPVSVDLGGTVRTVVVRGSFANSAGASTITHFTAALDGHRLQDFAPASAASQVMISLSHPGGGGHHTVRLTVVAQTASPSPYRSFTMSASLVDVELFSSRPVRTVALPDKTASLPSGGTITYDFDL